MIFKLAKILRNYKNRPSSFETACMEILMMSKEVSKIWKNKENFIYVLDVPTLLMCKCENYFKSESLSVANYKVEMNYDGMCYTFDLSVSVVNGMIRTEISGKLHGCPKFDIVLHDEKLLRVDVSSTHSKDYVEDIVYSLHHLLYSELRKEPKMVDMIKEFRRR